MAGDCTSAGARGSSYGCLGRSSDLVSKFACTFPSIQLSGNCKQTPPAQRRARGGFSPRFPLRRLHYRAAPMHRILICKQYCNIDMEVWQGNVWGSIEDKNASLENLAFSRLALVTQRGFEPRTLCLKGKCSAD